MIFIIHAITVAAVASHVHGNYFDPYGNNYYPNPFYQYQQQGTYDCPSGACCSQPCPYENTPIKILTDINTPNYFIPPQGTFTQAIIIDQTTANKLPTGTGVMKVRLGRYWRDIITIPLCNLAPAGQCNLLASLAQCIAMPQFGADKFLCLGPNLLVTIPSPSFTLRPGRYDFRFYRYSSAGEVLSCSQSKGVPTYPTS